MEMFVRRYRLRSQQEAPSAALARAIFSATCFSLRWYDHVFLQLQLPVHAKAGSRWPELPDVRYAVVSLLSSPAPGLVPA